MGTENYRKSGQIPAFGDWENASEMPITQYFECARQAGLLRCSCSGECGGSYGANAAYWGGGGANSYGVGYEKPLPLPRRVYAVPERKARGVNKGYPHSNEQMKKVKVRDLMNQPRLNPTVPHKHHPKQSNTTKSGNLVQHRSSVSAKPVDEDLYKIPPELLENSKRVSNLLSICTCFCVKDLSNIDIFFRKKCWDSSPNAWFLHVLHEPSLSSLHRMIEAITLVKDYEKNL
ncbi:uncharacterized protein LOC121751344 isoform X2 [Salvia splendens]|uniref:uncharacterized protein LOC121751344 isoform X2 n=1 Tax=Salvia splendens TaxID=180675 RepID=UPI001C25B312|nr:uncharacterized protein LOC121751344 isoform X2 [Salvia splendens]